MTKELKKNTSSFSSFTSKNIEDHDLPQKCFRQISMECKPAKPEIEMFPTVQLKPRNSRFSVRLIAEEQNMKFKQRVKNKHLLNYFPVYTTLLDSDVLKSTFNPNVRMVMSPTINEDQMNQHKDRLVSIRKSLTPLKRVQIQRKSQDKNVYVSFLKVEKAPCTYQEPKNPMTITTSQLCKNKFLLTKKSFESQTLAYENSLHNKDQKALLIRNRPFVIPFERYYYLDFIWKVALSNEIQLEFPESYAKKFKAYVGFGNNSNLIKTLLKRRESWWMLTDRIEEANFVWTQLKVNSVFSHQDNYASQKHFHQGDILISHLPAYRKNRKIMSERLTASWMQYFNQNKEIQGKMNHSFKRRNKIFRKGKPITTELEKLRVHNHLQRNYVLGNKKALFATMRKYYQAIGKDVFQYLPLTFHIQRGLQDQQYFSFLKYYHQKGKQNKFPHRRHNIWIVKPGQLTNRGAGITVCHTLDEIKAILKTKIRLDNGSDRTYIVQEYIERPFLYHGRKFDIRHYMLFTFVNGHIKGYWCQLGYIRTTSYDYSLNNGYESVHLTNDAVQKMLPDYGKFQKGNKLSYDDFQLYLEKECGGKYSFYKMVYPQLKAIAYDSMRASALLLDESRKGHNFEIFGFDFMIDDKFQPWLIQINTNPCLQLNSPVLMQVIPKMVENALKIGLDSIFPPPQSFTEKRARFNNNVLQDNIFQLIYDSTVEDQPVGQIESAINFKDLEKDQEEVFQDDGVMLED